MVKNKNIKTAMSIILIVVFTTQLKAQEKPTSFLKKYYSMHAFVQYTNNIKGVVIKQDPSVNYDILSYITPQFGVLFNVFQTNNFNFKVGIVLKNKMLVEGFNFTQAQTNSSYGDFSYITELGGDDNMWSFPFIVEYIYPINKRIKWMVAPSITVSSYRDYGGYGLSAFGPIPRAALYTTKDNRGDKPIHSSAEISTGFYLLFKHFMLQPEFRYSKSFTTLKSGSYVTDNYRTGANNTTGTYTLSGDYWGFSLSIYVKKKNRNKKKGNK